MQSSFYKLTITLYIIFLVVKGTVYCGDLIGNSQPANFTGLVSSAIEDSGYLWTWEMEETGAEFIKIHFSTIDLKDNEFLTIKDKNNRQITGYSSSSTGQGSFWSLSVPGEIIKVEIIGDSGVPEISIDLYLAPKDTATIKTVCDKDEREDIICYTGTDKYETGRAIGRLIFEDPPSSGQWYACTGFLISPEGHFLTNEHCINSQDVADTAEVIFDYEKNECNSGITSYSISTLEVDYLTGNSSLDFSLLKLYDNPAPECGYLEISTRYPLVDEPIYIIQHPGGGPKQISVLNSIVVDPKQSGDTSTSDYFLHSADTSGGSSGSPVLDEWNKVIGLHRAGGCDLINGNIAVKMSEITPFISPFITSGPYTPNTPIPADNDINIPTSVDLNWTSGHLLGGEITYDLKLSTTATPSDIIADGLTTNTYDPGPLTNGTDYYWQVIARDSEGIISEGPVWHFTTTFSAPIARFRTNSTMGYIPFEVAFQNDSLNATSYEWDFNDDGLIDSTETNPFYSYESPGTYTVTLTAGNGSITNTHTIVDYIAVSGPPAADASMSIKSGIAPLTVQFNDESAGATAWSWDFDSDGIKDSTVKNPIHTFNNAGSYYVTLEVENPAGTSLCTIPDPVVVCTALTAEFSATPLTGCASLAVNFTDESIGEIEAWSWDFENDGVIDSTDQNPTHIYDVPGVFSVALKVSGASSMDCLVKPYYINVYGEPEIHISPSKTEGCAPLTVTFENHSDGDSFAWDFDNDGVIDSTEIFPTYTYEVAGVYSVRVVAENPCVRSEKVFENLITVMNQPVASAVADVYEGCSPLTVNFTNTSTGYAQAFKWDFNDNGCWDSTSENPTKTFFWPGEYHIKLKAINDCGYDYQEVAIIKVHWRPFAGFCAYPRMGIAPHTVKFKNWSFGNIQSYSWDFNGDGIEDSTESCPVFTYNEPGIYDVSLTASNECSTDTFTRNNFIVVIEPETESNAPIFDGLKRITPGNGYLTLKWKPALDDSPPVSYQVYQLSDPDNPDSAYPIGLGEQITDTKVIIPGLTNGVTYHFMVRAIDTWGNMDNNTNIMSGTPKENIAGGINLKFEVLPESTPGSSVIPGNPLGWEASGALGGEKNVAISLTDEAFEGNYAALIEVSGNPGDEYDITTASLVSTDSVLLSSGHTYMFSARIKRSHSQWFRMIVFGGGYSVVHLENFDALDALEGPTDWERYSVYYTVPSEMGVDAPHFLRIDNMIKNTRTYDEPCSLLVDDIEIIDLGIEETIDTYTSGPTGAGIRNSEFNFGTEIESVEIGGRIYTSYTMPLGWNIDMASRAVLNDDVGYPQWGQIVPPISNTNGPAGFLAAKAADLSAPAYPSLATDLRINPLYRGARHVLKFKYGASGNILPNSRIFLISNDFNHTTCLLIDPDVGIPGNKLWSISLHYTPDLDDDALKVRIDNITMDQVGFHTEPSVLYVDDIRLETPVSQ